MFRAFVADWTENHRPEDCPPIWHRYIPEAAAPRFQAALGFHPHAELDGPDEAPRTLRTRAYAAPVELRAQPQLDPDGPDRRRKGWIPPPPPPRRLDPPEGRLLELPPPPPRVIGFQRPEPTLPGLLTEYEGALRRGWHRRAAASHALRPNTIRVAAGNLRTVLARMAKILSAAPERPEDFTTEAVIRWQDREQHGPRPAGLRPLRHNTLRHYSQDLAGWLEWLGSNGHLERRVEVPPLGKETPRRPQLMTMADADRLIAILPRYVRATHTPFRLQALILRDTAIRQVSLAQVRARDFTLANPEAGGLATLTLEPSQVKNSHGLIRPLAPDTSRELREVFAEITPDPEAHPFGYRATRGRSAGCWKNKPKRDAWRRKLLALGIQPDGLGWIGLHQWRYTRFTDAVSRATHLHPHHPGAGYQLGRVFTGHQTDRAQQTYLQDAPLAAMIELLPPGTLPARPTKLEIEWIGGRRRLLARVTLDDGTTATMHRLAGSAEGRKLEWAAREVLAAAVVERPEGPPVAAPAAGEPKDRAWWDDPPPEGAP